MPQVRHADHLCIAMYQPIRGVSNKPGREILATGTRRQTLQERREVIVREFDRKGNKGFSTIQELPYEPPIRLGKARRRLFKAKVVLYLQLKRVQSERQRAEVDQEQPGNDSRQPPQAPPGQLSTEV